MRPEELKKLFENYTYSFIRPNTIPNATKTCDCSLFTAWYTSITFNIPSLLYNNVTSWSMYANLVYSKRLFWEGKLSNFDLSYLKNSDIVIFSNMPEFNVEEPNAYWCGIYWDKNKFLNFNEDEGFGTKPIQYYLNKYGKFTYISVLRIRNIVSYSFAANENETRRNR